VLIPSHYATSPRTRSLRPVRVPSDQNSRWRLPFHFRPIDDKNFLSPHICQISLHFRFKVGMIYIRRDAAPVRHNQCKDVVVLEKSVVIPMKSCTLPFFFFLILLVLSVQHILKSFAFFI